MPAGRRGSKEPIGKPDERRDIAIASAAQAFAVLCEALTELVEVIRQKLAEED